MASNERTRLISDQGDDDSSKGRYRLKCTCACILICLMLERVAFYSVTGNLVLFLNGSPIGWLSANALNASFFFLGISFMMSLFGGWLADSILGRFRTILIAFLIYIIGYVSLILVSDYDVDTDAKNQTVHGLSFACMINNKKTPIEPNPPTWVNVTEAEKTKNAFDENCAWIVYLGLFIIAVGSGVAKANIAPFGADQVRTGGSQATLKFFNWFYWCINIGSFIALGVIAYVQQQKSFLYGFSAAMGCLGCSILIFVAGSGLYTRRPAAGSVLSNICKIIREAVKVRRRKRTQYEITYDRVDNTGKIQTTPKLLDYAKYRYGGSYHDSSVEDVRQLIKILVIFLTLIPYWMVYFQMQTTYTLQGLHMKLNIKPYNNSGNGTDPTENPEIVAAWFSLFDVIFLIILIPFVDRFLYPRLKSAGYPFGMTKRIALGMVFAVMSVITAGVVEYYRLKKYWPDPNQPCKANTIPQKIGQSIYNAADMSIFWQIPQYAMIGISEVFTSIGGLELAYLLAPKSMKAIIMGLFYFISGVGSFLGTAVIYSLQGTWFFGTDDGDINCRVDCQSDPNTKVITKACHLDFYFFVLAGIEFVGLVLFLIVAKYYRLDLIQMRQKIARMNSFPENENKQNKSSSSTKKRQGLLSGTSRNIQRPSPSSASNTDNE